MGKLSLFVGSGDLIMVGRGWMWVVAVKNGWLWVAGVKLWQVVGGGDKIMADRGWWWRRNCAWSWVVVGVGGKIITGSVWLHDSVIMPIFSKTCRTKSCFKKQLLNSQV